MRLAIYFAALYALSVSTVHGQDIVPCDSTIAYWVFTQAKDQYSMPIYGKFQTTEKASILSVGDYALQALIMSTSDYITEGEDVEEIEMLKRRALLKKKFLQEQFNTGIEIKMVAAPITSEKSAILWWYDMPEGMNVQVTHQVQTSLVMDDIILELTSPVFSGQELDKLRDFHMDHISRLKKLEGKKALKNICDQ